MKAINYKTLRQIYGLAFNKKKITTIFNKGVYLKKFIELRRNILIIKSGLLNNTTTIINVIILS